MPPFEWPRDLSFLTSPAHVKPLIVVFLAISWDCISVQSMQSRTTRTASLACCALPPTPLQLPFPMIESSTLQAIDCIVSVSSVIWDWSTHPRPPSTIHHSLLPINLPLNSCSPHPRPASILSATDTLPIQLIQPAYPTHLTHRFCSVGEEPIRRI